MNILLTGDDGYNSIGTRVLIQVLQKDHKLTVVGTKTQQSAVGGKLNIKTGGSWVETSVDGVQAFCIDGSPCDAMEFAYAKIPQKFDLLISGVNLGENVGVSSISSGTVCAAWRGLGLEVAQNALALSWVTPGDFYFRKHDESDPLDEFLETPGKMVRTTIKKVIENSLWGSNFLNINFPAKHSEKMAWAKLAPSIKACYPPISVNEDNNTFSYPFSPHDEVICDTAYDIAALRQGNITLTPLHLDWTDHALYRKLENEKMV